MNILDYDEAMEYIENTAKFGSNLGLDRIKRLLYYMGNPEKKLKCIHIAGTNGKGSVVSMISSILIESGYKVGIYTSPYLQRFSERIKVNDTEISCEDTARLVTCIKPLVERVVSEGYDHPTEFEIITAIMFQYFYEMGVDLAVIEVGLGGRLDSTNVIDDPLVSVITSISYDHMAVLGNTLGKIAYEKAGIIKQNGITVSYPQQSEAYDVIKNICSVRNAKFIPVDSEGIVLKNYSMDGQVFDLTVDGETYKDLKMSLIGEHQLLNAKTALTVIKALSLRNINIKSESIADGLRKVRWPGRLEVMSKNPAVVLDGAHNIEGIESLKKALNKYFRYKKLILVIGILKDKQYDEMCSMLMPMADKIVTVTPDSPRALSSCRLKEIALNYCSDVYSSTSIEDAYKTGMHSASECDLVLFCGSLYMIGHIRSLIEQNNTKK